MFVPKKERDTAKICLPKRDSPPDSDYLKEAMSQADNKPGQEVEGTWTDSANGNNFRLLTKVECGALRPVWTLWEDTGRESKCLWQYETNDLQLIGDMLCMLQPSASTSLSPSPSPFASASPSVPTVAAPINHPTSELRPLSTPLPAAIEQLGADDFISDSPTAEGVPQIPPAPSDSASLLQPDQSARYAGSPAVSVRDTIDRVTRSFLGPVATEMRVVSAMAIEGSLERVPVPSMLKALSMAQLTGKLEIVGEQRVGRVYFTNGMAVHATSEGSLGDSAVCELVAWRHGIFRFVVDDTTPMRSVQNSLDANVMEGIALLDQRKHLEGAGLSLDSFIVRKHKKLSDSELKVILTKGHSVDFEKHAEVYRVIGQRCTLADLLRDRPMESPTWTRILFNFLTCGLIDIKPPEAVSKSVLDFLGDSQAGAQEIVRQMLRPETGIHTYHALLYLLEYEFYRFESYGWPLTLVLLELNQKKAEGGLDAINAQAISVVAKRIALVKRPLDTFAHFETIQYALLLPNTKAPSGAYVANRILQALLATPLATGIDRKNLHIAMGIASLPADGDDIEGLIIEAKNALKRARDGDFPIVLATGKH